jgi:hypothetical protein
VFIDTLSIDDVMTGAEETYAGAQVDLALVERLIRRLDGVRHTMVTLASTGSGAGARMAIGGHAGSGLVVYETDEETFHILAPGDVVSMAAGRARGLVGVDQALKAAREFATSGRLAPNLVWQRY